MSQFSLSDSVSWSVDQSFVVTYSTGTYLDTVKLVLGTCISAGGGPILNSSTPISAV